MNLRAEIDELSSVTLTSTNTFRSTQTLTQNKGSRQKIQVKQSFKIVKHKLHKHNKVRV